ncbi:MAG: dihydroneopterin aldolase [Candidatus Omnitrophica bacterium]|nr:dihydroneopterin aldolase [Candidatus Omnitrophota bacterium]
MADRLLIQDLVADCRIGLFEWEQERAQKIWIDLEMPINAAAAAERDDVDATVDYGRLVRVVKEHVERRPYRLLETLAEELAALVLEQFHLGQVTVRIKKRAVPGIDYAAVEVTRQAPQ